MDTSGKVFLVQSREGKWARCIRHVLPPVVRYSAYAIFEITPGGLVLVKQTEPPEGVGPGGPRMQPLPKDLSTIPDAKMLAGLYSNNVTAMVLASLGKEKDKKTSRMCFAFADTESGFYVGHDSRDFTEVVVT